jgi:hypothetical protein
MRPLSATLQLRALLDRTPERGRQRIIDAIARGGTVEQGARLLRVPLRTLYRIMHECGMPVGQGRPKVSAE